jgi:transcriptional regulator with XRE-family HTH domain
MEDRRSFHLTIGVAKEQTRAQPASSPLLKEFGKRVSERRAELELTQEEVAEAAGIHFTYVHQIEAGVRNLSLENLAKLAKGLEMDLGELLKGLQKLRGRA